jgi:hypothetical protein
VFAEAMASNRRRSQDRTDVIAHGDALVVVVADGAGGMRGGATASDALVDAVRSRLAQGTLDPYDLRAWSELLEETDSSLARALAGETTAVLVVIGEHGVVGLSAGDSEAWVVSPTAIDRLTETQSRQRIGSGRATPTSFHRRALEGTLLVGTDGLFKYVDAASIVAACSGPVIEAADRLAALPRLASGVYPDDVAAVVVARA